MSEILNLGAVRERVATVTLTECDSHNEHDHGYSRRVEEDLSKFVSRLRPHMPDLLISW